MWARFLNEEIGEYPIMTGDLCFTISISEPYEGFCYKLVAGMIGCSGGE